MIKPMTITELKKELKKLDNTELNELVLNIYKTNDKVKDIINVKFAGEEYQKQLLKLYKDKMFVEFFPKNMRKMDCQHLIRQFF
jgi:hypothetical protein